MTTHSVVARLWFDTSAGAAARWPALLPVGAVYYQYRAERARRSLRGIDEQVRKAADAAAGRTAVKRNRFVRLEGGSKSVNRELEAKTRTLAGWKAYITTWNTRHRSM